MKDHHFLNSLMISWVLNCHLQEFELKVMNMTSTSYITLVLTMLLLMGLAAIWGDNVVPSAVAIPDSDWSHNRAEGDVGKPTHKKIQ